MNLSVLKFQESLEQLSEQLSASQELHFKELVSLNVVLTETSANIQNCWVFGLFPSSGILETRKHDVSETSSVSVLR
jgi:hypothetical protein